MMRIIEAVLLRGRGMELFGSQAIRSPAGEIAGSDQQQSGRASLPSLIWVTHTFRKAVSKIARCSRASNSLSCSDTSGLFGVQPRVPVRETVKQSKSRRRVIAGALG